MSPHDPLQQYDALLHEDLVVPVHDHRPGRDRLVAMLDDGPREVTPGEAGRLVAARTSMPCVTEVEHLADGPRGLRRRDVLAGAAAGLGAMLAASAQPRYSFAATTTPRDLLVVVFLRGGFDGLSAVVPVDDPAYYGARPATAVPASATTPLARGYALNTALAPLRSIWDAGQLAVVPHVGHPWITRSHFDDQVSAERCALPSQRSGWLGRHLQTSSAATGTFRGVTFRNTVTTSLTTTAFETLAMTSVDRFRFEGWEPDGSRALQQAAVQRWYAGAGGEMATQAAATLRAIDGLARLRAAGYTPATGATYPDTALGNGLREVARVAKGGVGLEVACVDSGDWDMHTDLVTGADRAGRFRDTAADLAASLGAFRTDLGAAWDRTVVLTMSEFGRRVAENGDRGADHGNGTTMLALGGGIRGGVYGRSVSLTAGNLTDGSVPVLTDFRQPISEIVSNRLANAAGLPTIFPGFVPGPALGITR